jgi:hypothetical protein
MLQMGLFSDDIDQIGFGHISITLMTSDCFCKGFY